MVAPQRCRPGRWAERAASLYDGPYARRYRRHDEEFVVGEFSAVVTDWLRETSASLSPPIDVLDLGCGTGRYFWALQGVNELVGIDASAAMLAEARQPVNADRVTASVVTLMRGDLLGQEFEADRFDLVYSIGVLAEHVPLDEAIVARVARWLKPGGLFALTTVRPDSPSIPRTWKRRAAERVAAFAPSSVRERLRTRLLSGGCYADERQVRELLDPAFDIESLIPFHSEAHLHCRCLARRKPQ